MPVCMKVERFIDYCASASEHIGTCSGERRVLQAHCVETVLIRIWGRPWAHHAGRPSSTAWQSPRTAGLARVLATMHSSSVQCSMRGVSWSGAERWQNPVALLPCSQRRGTPVCVQAHANDHRCPALTTRATVMLRPELLSSCKCQVIASPRLPQGYLCRLVSTASHVLNCDFPGDGSGTQWCTCCVGKGKRCLLKQSLLSCVVAVFSKLGEGSSQASTPA